MSRIYIGNVSSTGKLDELKNMFEDCGKLKNFDIKESSGYIEYETQEEAEEAIKKLNGKSFNDKYLVVEPSRRPLRTRKPPSSKNFGNSYHHKKYYRSRSSSRSSRSDRSYRKRHSRRKRSHSSPKRSRHHRHHSRHSRHSRSRSRSHS